MYIVQSKQWVKQIYQHKQDILKVINNKNTNKQTLLMSRIFTDTEDNIDFDFFYNPKYTK